ncbi:hypothetical protein GCM10007858_01330 [Bradyrhizobium liaoningense]|nr:hypothetical protein GCM10007858_01330 [Bradyrhizobium liaoningense]
MWGVHMWPPVKVLFDVLDCARRRLPEQKRTAYLPLLADEAKHQEYLAEMLPMLRVSDAIPAEHEVTGLGAGNRTVDWVLGAAGTRRILFDVKRRFADFYSQMTDAVLTSGAPPAHDVQLLFRSVEPKFLAADPDNRLQGAWIVTDIKQDETELRTGFDALDPAKVHFAILGDAQSDMYILTRRPEDIPHLLSVFGASQSNRFVFDRRTCRPQTQPSKSEAVRITCDKFGVTSGFSDLKNCLVTY